MQCVAIGLRRLNAPHLDQQTAADREVAPGSMGARQEKFAFCHWVDLLVPPFDFAPAFNALGSLAGGSLDRAMRQKAAVTLRRHLLGRGLWCELANHHDWPMYDPLLLDSVALRSGSSPSR